MKKYFVSVLMVFFAVPVLACPYKIIIGDQKGAQACVDAVTVKQLRPDTYRVTFANYFPGTKLPIDRYSFYLNGSKDVLEKHFVTLHEILTQYKVGNLVFSSKTSFYLEQKAIHEFTEPTLELIEYINANLK